MRSVSTLAFYNLAGRVILALACAVSPAAFAALLSFDVIVPDRTGPSNATYLFTGTLTNSTGVNLQATDVFFDFSGYDSGVLTPTQLLGNPDFAIADGSTSAVHDLFDLAVGAAAVPGQTYKMDALLQDASGNLSDTITVSVHVVPEPSAALILLSAGLLAAMMRRGRAAGQPS